MLTCTCIVPGHNEGPRIAGVIRAVRAARLVTEVIAVDDGSTDDTAAQAAAAGARVVVLRHNRGKARAMDEGVRRAAGDLVLFLDSDLQGLTGPLVDRLAAPVVADAADVTLGIVERGIERDRRQENLPALTGQRCFHRVVWWKMCTRFPRILECRFGIEMGLNRIAYDGRLRLKVVDLSPAWDPSKRDKFGYVEGSVRRLNMWLEIERTTRYLATGQLR